MRLRTIFTVAAAFACIGLGNPDRASATDLDHKPHGWGHTRTIHHHVYYPRYRHVYHIDPYAYQYSPRGYYPYYNSGYWTPAYILKARNRAHFNYWNTQPPRYKYYKSWGYPKHWHHKEWHYEHHGHHHRWHW